MVRERSNEGLLCGCAREGWEVKGERRVVVGLQSPLQCLWDFRGGRWNEPKSCGVGFLIGKSGNVVPHVIFREKCCGTRHSQRIGI